MQILSSKDIGKLIKRSRKAAKLTQTQLAAASGTGERFIRELENGKTTCQLGKALFILQMLGIKLEAKSVATTENK